jgi:hypothetical protein
MLMKRSGPPPPNTPPTGGGDVPPMPPPPSTSEQKLLALLEFLHRSHLGTYYSRPYAASAARRAELLARAPDDPERLHFEAMKAAHQKYAQFRRTGVLPELPITTAGGSDPTLDLGVGVDVDIALPDDTDAANLTPEQQQQQRLANEYQRQYYYGERGAQQRALRQLGFGTRAQLQHYAASKRAFSAVQNAQKRARRQRLALRRAHDEFERTYGGAANAAKRARVEALLADADADAAAKASQVDASSVGGGGGGRKRKGLTGAQRREVEKFARLRAAYDEWQALLLASGEGQVAPPEQALTPEEQRLAQLQKGYVKYRSLGLHVPTKRRAWLRDDPHGDKQRLYDELRQQYNGHIREQRRAKVAAEKEAKKKTEAQGGGGAGIEVGTKANESGAGVDPSVSSAISGGGGSSSSSESRHGESVFEPKPARAAEERERSNNSERREGGGDRLLRTVSAQGAAAVGSLSSGAMAATAGLQRARDALVRYGPTALHSSFFKPSQGPGQFPSLSLTARGASGSSAGHMALRIRP